MVGSQVLRIIPEDWVLAALLGTLLHCRNFCMLADTQSGYSPSHFSFACLSNLLHLFLFSLPICNNWTFTLVFHSTFSVCISTYVRGCTISCCLSYPSFVNLLTLSIKFCAVLDFSWYYLFQLSWILFMKFLLLHLFSQSNYTILNFSSLLHFYSLYKICCVVVGLLCFQHHVFYPLFCQQYQL